MASPNSIFTEMVTSTFRYTGGEIADNVSKNHILYDRLAKKGQIMEVDGGYEIQVNLDYAENGTFQWYSGYELLNVSASEVLSAANAQWKQGAIHVTASGFEIRANMGSRERIFNLVKARNRNAMRTFANNLGTDSYSDGTGSGGKQLTGLQALIADTGTGTVQGINSSTYTFWRNIVQSAAAPLGGGGAITPSKTTIRSLMNPLYLNLTRGSDQTDLIAADANYYSMYEEGLQDNQRYMDSDLASAGFYSLKYKRADVFCDVGSGIPANHMYFMNTDYLDLVVHRDANMTELDEKVPVQQDAVVVPFLWMGNLVVRNRKLQGVLKA